MKPSVAQLRELARRMRIDIVRMLHAAGSGHPGGSLSCIDLLATLFSHEIERTPRNAADPGRDRVVLSKGHAVPALYACLARAGVIEREELWSLRRLGSRLQGHPDVARLPAVEASTGSLGQGMSIAQGMALAGKMARPGFRVFCLVGDGETQEGQMWECAMSAPKFGLSNLTVILDANGGQIDGFTKDVMNIEPIADKMRAFGWRVLEIDGHDFPAILSALDQARAGAAAAGGAPTYILARTVKGQGVSFMAGDYTWHGKAPDTAQAVRALEELGADQGEIAAVKATKPQKG
ncbi:MAG: transketolase [Planctomycetes bacterium]|nr:transketolase [Planctomycetota bacterium]